MSHCEKKLKSKLDGEIKLAGLEALGGLEKHLIFNSNRLRSFEDACLEIVTYVEAKFGLRISNAKRGDAMSRGHSDPMDVDAVNSFSSGREKCHRVHVRGSSRVVVFTVNATALHAKVVKGGDKFEQRTRLDNLLGSKVRQVPQIH